MKPYYETALTTLYNNDCRNMTEIEDNSVHCIVTSPPYFGLRLYSGLPDLVWGGDPLCEHEWVSTSYLMHNGRGDAQKSCKYSTQESIPDMPMSNSTCSKCGAWLGQLGLEPTLELYISHLIEIMREMRRVLRKDGMCFINIGDSYASSPPGNKELRQWQHGNNAELIEDTSVRRSTISGNLKSKDLCLIPQRLAIAAQADGWWVRSMIIWEKGNPMPESINGARWERHRIKIGKGAVARRGDPIETGIRNAHYDAKGLAEWQDCPGCEKCNPNGGLILCKGSWRPTNSHEYILMLTKRKNYFGDAEVVREPHQTNAANKLRDKSLEPYNESYRGGHFSSGLRAEGHPNGRNLRDIWTMNTQPYSGAHFATFPEKLPETCIKAATSEAGCCSKCGKPLVRIVKTSNMIIKRSDWGEKAGNRTASSGTMIKPSESETIGWKPQCNCNADVIPCTVLDPFAGSCTTLAVAKRMGRQAIGYELSADYCKLGIKRIEAVTAPFPGLPCL